jgi:S1-C subfamily serine protease
MRLHAVHLFAALLLCCLAACGPREPAGAGSQLGLQLEDVPEAARTALGVRYGVMVTRVRGPASRTRILPGDVIVRVNEAPVRNLEEFNRLIAEKPAGAIGVFVRRADADLYITLRAAVSGGNRPPDENFRERRKATSTLLRT